MSKEKEVIVAMIDDCIEKVDKIRQAIKPLQCEYQTLGDYWAGLNDGLRWARNLLICLKKKTKKAKPDPTG